MPLYTAAEDSLCEKLGPSLIFRRWGWMAETAVMAISPA